MVVISIIALLSSIISVSLIEARKKSKQSKVVADMIQIRNAAELYRTDTAAYPNTLDVLVPSYLPVQPKNPFNNSVYSVTTERFQFLGWAPNYACGSDYEAGRLVVVSSFISSPVSGDSNIPGMKYVYAGPGFTQQTAQCVD